MKDNKFISILDKITVIAGGAALVAMIACTSLNVFSRFIFNQGVKWSEEYGYLFFCWVVFLGAASCYYSRELISINVFVLMLPDKVQQALFVIKRCFMIVVNIWLFKIAIEFTIGGAAKVTSLMKIPFSWLDAAVAVMFGLVIIYSVKDAYLAVTGKEEADKERHAE